MPAKPALLRAFPLMIVPVLIAPLAGAQEMPAGDTIRFRIHARAGLAIRYTTVTEDSGEVTGGDPEDADGGREALLSFTMMGLLHQGTLTSAHSLACRSVAPDGSSNWELQFSRFAGTSMMPGLMAITFDMQGPRVEARALSEAGLPDPDGVHATTGQLRELMLALKRARIGVRLSPAGRVTAMEGARELEAALDPTPSPESAALLGGASEAADSAFAQISERLVGRLYHTLAPEGGVTLGGSWEVADTLRAPSGIVIAVHAARSTLDSVSADAAWVTTRMTLTTNLAGSMMEVAREMARMQGQPIDEAELERSLGDVTRVREGLSVVAVSLRDGLPIASTSRETTTTFFGAAMQGLTAIQRRSESVRRAK